jgi:hypothetical protein
MAKANKERFNFFYLAPHDPGMPLQSDRGQAKNRRARAVASFK